MYLLTEEQVDYILHDIQARGIGDESLQQDLLDHVCCIIEQELEEYGDFGTCYHSVIRKFYRKNLKEIEEEKTLLLTFQNYYAMKKMMLYSGAFTVGALLLGSLFKIAHWPGANVLLVCGIACVSLVFLPLLAVVKSSELKKSSGKWALVTGILTGSGYFVSMLFLLMHWPGARIIWFSTLLFAFFVFVPVFFFNGMRKEETRTNTLVFTVVLLAVMGTQFALTALHNPRQQQEKIEVATEK